MTYPDLKKRLQRRDVPPLLFFYGEETQALEECLQQTIDVLLEPHLRDFNLHLFAARDNDIEGILNAAQTMPVFASRCLVVVKNVDELPSAHQKLLIEYLLRPVAETVLILTAGVPDKRLKLFQNLQKHALCVAFPRPKDNQLAERIKERLKEQGVGIDQDALTLFCQRCGAESVSWQGESDKLLSYLGEKKSVTVEDILAATLDGCAVSVFDVMNAVGHREPKSLITLRQALEDGMAPLWLLNMITRHFRQLWVCETLLRQGANQKSIPQQAGFSPFFLEPMLEQARRFTSWEYHRIFEWLLETDLAMKSTPSDGAALLESLVGRMVASGNNKGPGAGPDRS